MISYIIIFSLFIFILKHLFFWKPLNTDYLFKNGPLMIGHRGVPNEVPENTIEGFKNLIEYGIRVVEVDVVKTKDNHIICSHNFVLEIEPNGLGVIANKNFSEIKKFNTAAKFLNKNHISIPKLSKLIDELPENIIFNIEIKSSSVFDLKSVPLVLKILKEKKIQNRVFISSFNPLVLLLIKIIDKNFVTAYLWSNFDVPLILSKPWFVNIVHPDFIHPEAHLINKRLILFYKKRGLKINAWTVNNIPSKKWLLENGIDGIISDFPTVLLYNDNI